MCNDLVKTGACSIVLGENHYKHFIPIKHNKLLKITKIQEFHNEFKYLNLVKKINNYSTYYSIPDEVSYLLKPSDNFYNTVKELVKSEDVNFLNGELQCFYIDNAGDKDLLETFDDIIHLDFSFWKSYYDIFNFTKKIMEGLNYLHQNKICHLDIKPENIMVNTVTSNFKIIDFGYSSVEPFDDYVKKIKGTPGYFPKFFNIQEITGGLPWLPKIEATDMYLVNGQLPMIQNRKLVYKIDSYCLGRVLFFLNYIYKTNKTDDSDYSCFSCFSCISYFNNELESKIDDIISSLIENDVNERLTIQECILRYIQSNSYRITLV